MKIIIIKFIVLFFISNITAAQVIPVDTMPVQPVSISKQDIEKYRQQKIFDYHLKQESDNFIVRTVKWFKQKIIWLLLKFFNWLLGAKTAAKWLQYILKSLPYVAIILFSYLLFRFLIGAELIKTANRPAQKKAEVRFATDDENLIKDANLLDLIQQAEQSEDYRLALRYFYLKILKELTQKKIINWHPDKTNNDYAKEIADKDLKNSFKALSYIYDYVWYGKYYPAEKDYKNLKKKFLIFIEKLK